MRRYALIVAGGKGLRMGGDLPKQFIPMEGKPVLMHTLAAFFAWNPSAELLLVLPKDHQPYWKMLCEEIGFTVPHRVVDGGETRFHSVRNGLDFISEELSLPFEKGEKVLIAVHDGVRPFVSGALIDACFARAEYDGAAIPVISLVDSIRRNDADGSHPVDRNSFCAVQTPQVFRGEMLVRAYEQCYRPSFTDDASVVEALGEKVFMVPGAKENIKITTPFDLLVAEALFKKMRNENNHIDR